MRVAGAAARVFGGVWWSAHAAYTTRTIAPNSLDFPTVHSGQTTAAQAVTVTNDGPAALHNAGVELQGFDAGDFTITSDSCLGATMQRVARARCRWRSHRATPRRAPGPKTAELRLFDGAPVGGSGRAIALRGSSTTWTVSANELGFGDVPVGFRSAPMDLTMSNDGPTALYIGGIDLQGSDQWTVVERPDCLGAEPVGARRLVHRVLVFVPTGAAGPRAVTVYLVDGSPTTTPRSP